MVSPKGSVMRPPAFLMRTTSPSSNPRAAGSRCTRRASMHDMTAVFILGYFVAVYSWYSPFSTNSLL